ncbi:hypothetical protein DLP05_033 [Stenotrophomonas phage vB_SmaS_DLP_5]|uniref:Holin n=1 Tax=Stenotrophomonas phage vB_SmaS_DLP_5 TaxID=2044561 RepID=A0A2D2W2H9_9CAUD|nr:hypothetical protein FDJ07_gp032 [Stenotrophomonas phage vB_SmaS_DLP_5]ATS92352.1 hypothetical protein DLP05_033 [Stenotrophomonas phage vB_SmaS_DLP_5]
MAIWNPKRENENLENFGIFVGVMLTLLTGFMTIAPFFLTVPEQSQRLIDQQQTMLQTVFIALTSFLWGTSVGKRQDANTISKLADTAQITATTAQTVASPASVTLGPGQSADLQVNEDGSTVIQKDDGNQKVSD